MVACWKKKTINTPIAVLATGNNYLGPSSKRYVGCIRIRVLANHKPPTLAYYILTGTGKTTLINQITGAGAEIGHDISTGTKTFAMYPVRISSQQFIFIDTPGFGDSEMKDLSTLGTILQWFDTMGPKSFNLAGILYINDITQTRHKDDAKRSLDVLRGLTGPAYYPNICLVSTQGGTLSKARSQLAVETHEQHVKGPWKDICESGAKVWMAMEEYYDEKDFTEDQRRSMQEKLMEWFTQRKVGSVPLIQEEMRRELPIWDTTAAKILGDKPPKIESAENERKGWWRSLLIALGWIAA